MHILHIDVVHTYVYLLYSNIQILSEYSSIRLSSKWYIPTINSPSQLQSFAHLLSLLLISPWFFYTIVIAWYSMELIVTPVYGVTVRKTIQLTVISHLHCLKI